MGQNVYQLIDLQRIDPSKKPLKIRKIEFVETYESLSEGQAKTQVDRCLSCGNPYCGQKCPVHSYIPNWPRLINEGRIFETVELSHQTNTLPEVRGRVYPQNRLCGGSCTLNDEFGTVTIGNVERYISDRAFKMGWHLDMSSVKQTSEKVVIIDAGPAGLVRVNVPIHNGMKAIVFDRHPEVGGPLTFGIPAFKLEKEVTTRRRETFTDMGIEFKLNTEVGHGVQLDDLLSDYDAVFLGAGTRQSMHDGLENEDADGVYAALPLLTVNTRQLMSFGEARDEPFVSTEGKRVVILGGGDTAIDCVHTFIRQGTKHVTCAYHCDEENMPGSRREAKNAQEGGVEFKFNAQSLGIEVNDNGKASGVKVVRIEIGEPDAKGRRRAETAAGSEHIVSADAMIMAFGFRSRNMEWLAKYGAELDSQGRIITPEDNDNAFQTDNPKIPAGGDVVHGSDSVATAIAEGRKAVDGIMNWLEVQAR